MLEKLKKNSRRVITSHIPKKEKRRFFKIENVLDNVLNSI